jgi:hypothetical protein
MGDGGILGLGRQPIGDYYRVTPDGGALLARGRPASVDRLIGRRHGVMLVRDAPVAVDLAQAHGQPE